LIEVETLCSRMLMLMLMDRKIGEDRDSEGETTAPG